MSGHQLECLLRTFDLLHPRVDRPSAMMLWGIYPGRKILALTWRLLVPSARRGLRKDAMVDGWRPRICRPLYSSITYTICNTRNILFLLCLYLKRGNKLNVGIVCFEGKAPSRTCKTCLTMVELFAGPSSMAVISQCPQGTLFARGCPNAGCEVFCQLYDLAEEYFFLVNTSILY